MNKEIRKLYKHEFYNLMNNADISETHAIRNFINPYDFFKNNSVEQNGLVINGRPIYWGALTKINGKYELWTVVNSNVKEQITLFKETKKYLKSLTDKYGEITATMNTGNNTNIEWTKRLGGEVIQEANNFITFKIGG